MNQAIPPGDQPVPKSNSRLLQKLKHEGLPYAHGAWRDETPKTRSMLAEHYYEIHVVLQPSCCAPPSVFQATMGKELRLREGNFGSYSTNRVSLRDRMKYEEAKEFLGASCAVQEDKEKVWCVKMLNYIQLGDTSLVLPELRSADTTKQPSTLAGDKAPRGATRRPFQAQPLSLTRQGCEYGVISR